MRLVARERRDISQAVARRIKERRRHAEGTVLVHIRCIVNPFAADAGVVRVKARSLVFPGDTELNDMPPATERTFTHLDAVTVSVRGIATPVIAVAVSHGVAVLQHNGEFLVDKIKTVVAVPPGTAPDKLGGIALSRLLVMCSEAVSIFAIALPAQRIVVVVRIAIQEDVSAAIVGAVVRKESGARIVVAVNLMGVLRTSKPFK